MEMQGKYAVYAERARVARGLKAIGSAFGPRALRALALSMPRAADSVQYTRKHRKTRVKMPFLQTA
jgi:hypothetical protein